MQGQTFTTFSETDTMAFKPAMKIGLLATVNDEGLPHLSLIATLQSSAASQLCWGQFTEGLCKQFIRRNPKTGFLIMTLDKRLWCGKATFTHTANQGPEYEMYNNQQMFRYNAYFGVHTVYYMDLVSHTGEQALPMGEIVIASLQTVLAKVLSSRKRDGHVLNSWTCQLMDKIGNLKFLSFIDREGYPTIVPVLQAQTVGKKSVLFAVSTYKDALVEIPQEAHVAVFSMSLDMEDVLVRGRFEGIRRIGGVQCGQVCVDWVYNSMPPKPQQIYPAVDIKPVRLF